MVLFFIPFGVFIETTGNSKWWLFTGDTPGQVFGQQAFAFVVGTCLGTVYFVMEFFDELFFNFLDELYG